MPALPPPCPLHVCCPYDASNRAGVVNREQRTAAARRPARPIRSLAVDMTHAVRKWRPCAAAPRSARTTPSAGPRTIRDRVIGNPPIRRLAVTRRARLAHRPPQAPECQSDLPVESSGDSRGRRAGPARRRGLVRRARGAGRARAHGQRVGPHEPDVRAGDRLDRRPPQAEPPAFGRRPTARRSGSARPSSPSGAYGRLYRTNEERLAALPGWVAAYNT